MSSAGERACDLEVRAHEHGFTLFEMLAVMAVIALGSAAILRIMQPTTRDDDPEVAAGRIAAFLRSARSSAQEAGTTIAVHVDTAKRLISRSDNQAALTLPRAIAIRALTAEGANDATGLAGIHFFPNGSSSGAAIALSNDRKAYTIDVNWLTGRVGSSPQR